MSAGLPTSAVNTDSVCTESIRCVGSPTDCHVVPPRNDKQGTGGSHRLGVKRPNNRAGQRYTNAKVYRLHHPQSTRLLGEHELRHYPSRGYTETNDGSNSQPGFKVAFADQQC